MKKLTRKEMIENVKKSLCKDNKDSILSYASKRGGEMGTEVYHQLGSGLVIMAVDNDGSLDNNNTEYISKKEDFKSSAKKMSSKYPSVSAYALVRYKEYRTFETQCDCSYKSQITIPFEMLDLYKRRG